jgi:hypothetical protein
MKSEVNWEYDQSWIHMIRINHMKIIEAIQSYAWKHSDYFT